MAIFRVFNGVNYARFHKSGACAAAGATHRIVVAEDKVQAHERAGAFWRGALEGDSIEVVEVELSNGVEVSDFKKGWR